MFAVEQNPDGSVKLGANNLQRYHELTDAEKMNLRPSPDNKVHVANNGIFNSQEEPAKNAVQNSTAGAGPQYFIYFPKANNTVSDWVIAGYQNFLE